ncbi:hypothetical protein SBRCBS47491_010000 [Sporothrix bragantina]|uniref:Uncharacterized protein n=1 Tax=Sporothrix bragantina TaxID=671064 RepID=A0ABP0CZE3_9PEZI
MPLPTSLDPEDGDNMICFIAEIAVRRLSNRIHSSLYATEASGAYPDNDSSASGRTTPGNKRKRLDSDVPYSITVPGSSTGADPSLTAGPTANFDRSSTGKVLPISAELNRQLEAWYKAMPDNIRPPLLAGNRSSSVFTYDFGSHDIAENDPQWHDTQQPQHTTTRTLSERVQILRIHYYAARHIIHRPFVLGVAWQEQQQILAREAADSGGGRVSPSSAALPPLPLTEDILENLEAETVGDTGI